MEYRLAVLDLCCMRENVKAVLTKEGAKWEWNTLF